MESRSSMHRGGVEKLDPELLRSQRRVTTVARCLRSACRSIPPELGGFEDLGHTAREHGAPTSRFQVPTLETRGCSTQGVPLNQTDLARLRRCCTASLVDFQLEVRRRLTLLDLARCEIPAEVVKVEDRPPWWNHRMSRNAARRVCLTGRVPSACTTGAGVRPCRGVR